MTFAGIDPGASGGLAVISEMRITLAKMPNDEQGILAWVLSVAEEPTIAIIEQVTGWTGGGKKLLDGSEAKHGGAPGSHMFKFGMSYGSLRMALAAAGFVEGQTFHSVTPQKWQWGLGIEPRKKGTESKPQFKARLKRFAEELFPRVQGITLKTADALLIAEYCRRTRG